MIAWFRRQERTIRNDLKGLGLHEEIARSKNGGTWMLPRKLLGLGVLVAMLGLPFVANAQLIRPTTMGVGGSNESFTQNRQECTEEKGTLGALVTDGASLYILGAAHVLALGTSGYLGSGSGEPIVQPSLSSLGKSPLNLISCPPTASQLAVAQVATLSTVVPITFST
jgi:hypothetical protein